MAAGLGFKTFTTGEVLTAADTNGYLMQGILVFASAAARDAAITSPQEGQACYLKDTNGVLTYSGSTWVAVGGSAGGLTLLSTTATTSGATVTISNISQSHKHLLVIATGLTASQNTDYSMRFNSDSGTNYAAFNVSYIATTLSGAFGNAAQISVSALGTSTSNANTGNFSMNIYRYSEGSEFKNVTFSARSKSSVDVGRLGTIAYGSNTAISSISVTTDAGTFATGTIFVYGVN